MRTCLLLVVLLTAAGGLARGADGTSGANGGGGPGIGAGQTVSLSLESADLKAVVTALARTHNINVVGSDQLKGTVTLYLNRAPALEALEVILRSAGFALVKKDGEIYEVVPAADVGKVDAAKSVPRVQVFTLKYAQVEAVAKLLVPNVIPDLKFIGQDPTTNRLIISGTEAQLKNVEDVLKELDRPVPQVQIEARIVEVYTDRARSLGVLLDMNFPAEGVGKGGHGTATLDLTHNPVATSTFDFHLTTNRIDLALSALVQKEAAEILSAPKVTTGHGRKAEIKVVNQVPVITRTTRIVDTVTVTDEQVSFKETGLTLTVTPRVLADGQIEMVVEPTVNELTGFTDTVPSAPIINTRSAKTEVTITDGKWLVIGGLTRYNEHKVERGIPLLKDIPILGWLFKTSYVTRDKSDLIILVSATVLDAAKTEQGVRKVDEEILRHRKDDDLEGGPHPEAGTGATDGAKKGGAGAAGASAKPAAAPATPTGPAAKSGTGGTPADAAKPNTQGSGTTVAGAKAK